MLTQHAKKYQFNFQPFAEFRKRIYKEILGDKYVSPSTGLPSGVVTTPSNVQTTSLNASVNVANVEVVDTKETEKPQTGGDGSTQVREFFNSIKKCRESRPSRTDTEQIKSTDVESPPDSDEENREFFFTVVLATVLVTKTISF